MSYVVFTGDVIDSSALDAAALGSSLAGIQQGFAHIFDWPGVTTTGYSIRSGDGWQAAMDAPAYALRAAFFLRASMVSLPAQSRFAIATGAGTLPANGDTNQGHGPAFTNSGRLLDRLPKYTHMGWSDGGAAAACFALADTIAQGWTRAQGKALTLMLPPGSGTRADAAQQLGISRQAVDQSLNGAGYRAITAALHAWERQ